MTSPIAIPLTIGLSTGPQPTPPATLRTALVDAVAATNPGYTANLPGTLVEDVCSTDMGAVITLDQARVDAVNNMTPYAAAPYILAMLGAQAGIAQGLPTNTSVLVVFSGLAGIVLASGTLVSDGTYQYALQAATVIGSTGASAPSFCVATSSGSWAVPANSVTTMVTPMPSGYTVTVTNPEAGTPGGAAESVPSYRSRTLQAGRASALGFIPTIKAALRAVPGVLDQLVSVPQVGASWKVICGGGDPYQVAMAIYSSMLTFQALVESPIPSRNINIAIMDAPNIYNVAYVNPPQQIVSVVASWGTSLSNFTAAVQVNDAAQLAIQNYINAVYVGTPINILQMQDAVQEAIATWIPAQYLSSLTFGLTINGSTAAPVAGSFMIYGDSESYFSAALADIAVAMA